MIGPSPRFRLYSSPAHYQGVLRGLFSGGDCPIDYCNQLEAAIRSVTGARHALCAAKARVAIHLAVAALVEPGRKVVLSPYTISDVVNMVISAGGVPVFADIDARTCNIDPEDVQRIIDSDTAAVLVTHLHGLACDMERLVPLCREHGLRLIEDAAQAFGTRLNGRSVGTFGDAGVFSFGMYKNVNSFFGGMLLTSDADVDRRVRERVATFPPQEMGYFAKKVLSGLATDIATMPGIFQSFTYHVFRAASLHDVGLLNRQVSFDQGPSMKRVLSESYLRRMTRMQAKLVLSQLENLDNATRARIETARLYHEGLKDVPGLGLPPLRADHSHIYTYYPVQVDDRAAFLKHMMRARRDVAAQHLRNCADLPCFAEFARDCPNARRTAERLVLLPTYPRYGRREAMRNIDAIRDYFGEGQL